MSIKIDSDSLKLISYFEMLTHAKVKDLIPEENKVTFIIETGDMGKAIGKNGANIKKLEFRLHKKVRLVEFNPDISIFLRNMLYPLDVQVTNENGIATIHAKDSTTRAMAIGRERQNIRHLLEISKRYFDLKEIKAN